MILANQFDTLGRRTQLTATIGGTADFLNAYGYDGLSRMTHVEQRGQTGGNAVADKGVNFAYNALGQFTSIVRYTDLLNGPAVDVATSSFTYDSLSRLTALTHSHASNTLAGYSWTYDALSRVTHMESVLDGESNYTYDATSQLVGADHDFQTDEAYSFDANGNRNGTGEEVGAGNRPITDGVFNFTYDIEGNLIAKQRVSSSPADDYRTEYGWDHRNRLTSATFKDNAGVVTKYVETVYDVFDRRIGKRVDADGDGVFDRFERFVYDGDDVVLDFVDPDGAGSEPLELATRSLQGPAVDQILAQEDVETNSVLWQLTDNLGSVRDLVDSSGDLVAHYVYDSFGNLVDGADGQTRYLYTGREWDADIGLQYNRARWYDPVMGRWLSEDPIGFAAGDANVGRYVGNSSTNATDPSGLEYRGYWEGVGDVFIGYGDAAVGTATGAWFIVRHPIQTAKGIGTAIRHPIATGQAICEDVSEKSGSLRGQGGLVGDVLIGVASGGALKAASKAKTVAQLADKASDAGRVADKAADAGRIADKAADAVTVETRTRISTSTRAASGKGFTGTFARMNPNDIRFSQTTAGGGGRAAQLRKSMRKGWNGPAVDAVKTQDGVVTLDNSRIAIARELGISEVPVKVRLPSDPLPESMLGRFGDAKTWGEALLYRTGRQSPPIPVTGTSATPRLPK